MSQPISYSIEPVVPESNLPQVSNGLYVALGLEKEDAGYQVVTRTADKLGNRTLLTASLWHVATQCTLHELFFQLNTSMLDRRIDSHSSLLVLDPSISYAKWHVRQPLSDLIGAHWHYENNIFISYTVNRVRGNQKEIIQCITGLGTWAPLSKSIWYLSTNYSSKEVFQHLLNAIETGDQLCVFDSSGNLAFWQDDQSFPDIPAYTIGK